MTDSDQPVMTVDHDSPVPVYEQIADWLLDRILDGTYPPGRRLPPESAFGVNRITVRKATRELDTEGVVDVIPGRGSYVVDARTLAAYCAGLLPEPNAVAV